MKESFEIKELFKVKPSVIYEAWLDSDLHSKMTGGEAHCNDHIGEPFTAWDGYIQGRNRELIRNEEIIQSWRTVEFSDDDEDSKLIIRLRDFEGGTELTLKHTNIPEGQTQYEEGWTESYFIPMKEYFEKK